MCFIKERMFVIERKIRMVNLSKENKEKENDWIPVSTAKYPRQAERVHVTVDDGKDVKCIVAYLNAYGYWYEDKTEESVGYVTAWKPMQEIKPYKAEQIAEREKVIDWTPVTKDLPDELATVQVTYLSKVYGNPCCDGFAYMQDGVWCWAEDDSPCEIEITAWKPMCKPYRK